MESKNIKVYGTLVNHTLNSNMYDAQHNDAIAYAYQIYDDLFTAASQPINRYQDVINKRVSAITYSKPTTIIESPDNVAGGYTLVVNGKTNLKHDVKVDGILNALTIAVQNLTATNLTVTGDTDLLDVTINGTLTVDGAATFDSPITCVGITSSANIVAPNITQLRTDVDNILNQLSQIQSDITELKNLWHKETRSGVNYVVSGPSAGPQLKVEGAEFYDSTIN